MEFLWYAVAGVLGGVLGGMGMGGGTVLIPLLSIFYAVEQHTAQAVNLIAFIPMAVVAIIIHIKNGLLDFKGIISLIIPAVVLSAGGSFIASLIEGDLLKRLFGGFLIALSVFQIITGLRRADRPESENKEEK